MIAYERDGAAIYRRSFATIRAEADLDGLDPVLERAVVRMIHACGMVDLTQDIAASPRLGTAAEEALRGGAPILCEPSALHAAPGWFPLVGGLIGAAAAGTWALVEPPLGSSYATALALTVSGIASGGLHHDGLADTADGLGARGSGERRLAAMRDPGIGAFGALALIAWALLSLTALSRLSPSEAVAALICGHVLGRWSALPQLALVAPARTGGLGASFSAGPVAIAAGSACACTIVLAVCGLGAGAAALAGAAVATAVVAVVAKRCISGRTGDTLGASVLTAELMVYSVLAGYWAA